MAAIARSRLVRIPDPLARAGITLRPELPGDDAFLLALYRSTREHELAIVPDWDEGVKAAFIAQQFAAQRHHYRGTIENCAFDVIERNGTLIGRLYTQERQTQLHIVDIALVAGERGQGLGQALLEGLIAEAGRAGKAVGIFVEGFNPARRLYDRLGFQPIGEQGVYLEMERLPDAS
ncbi:MAG: GNAT family N-acetyltransferase [Sphingomonadales bacterium]|nr:GNAT family N-acetyltransferase [Sphingomonadales bacterium]